MAAGGARQAPGGRFVKARAGLAQPQDVTLNVPPSVRPQTSGKYIS